MESVIKLRSNTHEDKQQIPFSRCTGYVTLEFFFLAKKVDYSTVNSRCSLGFEFYPLVLNLTAQCTEKVYSHFTAFDSPLLDKDRT